MQRDPIPKTLIVRIRTAASDCIRFRVLNQHGAFRKMSFAAASDSDPFQRTQLNANLASAALIAAAVGRSFCNGIAARRVASGKTISKCKVMEMI